MNDLHNTPQPASLTEAQREELDRRLEDYHQNPNDGVSWEDLKKIILEGTDIVSD